ncbi:MAG: hypothetical protein PHH49_07425 [Candidatus Omnitrophica bacterium]|nr:hypothetical protein [Candidatus Omnitrophota bacterium]MDD5488765.1 hypothetical protein [Candidatus Omnitrophota bacterium]
MDDRKDLNARLLDAICELTRADVMGGYLDHYCQEEVKKGRSRADMGKLYALQKELKETGNRRAGIKNGMDVMFKGMVDMMRSTGLNGKGEK